MLLYSAVLEFACREGFKEFDFGRSSVDSGTYRFKQQWGAQPHQLYWYYWLAEGRSIPELNPDNPKFKAAISVWQHLPFPVTNLWAPYREVSAMSRSGRFLPRLLRFLSGISCALRAAFRWPVPHQHASYKS